MAANSKQLVPTQQELIMPGEQGLILPNSNMKLVKSESESEETAYGAKCLVFASLPYREPKDHQLENGAWVRRNGDYTLWIQGGPQGIPYGSLPRLFVIWLTTEAIKTGSRRISTGGTFSEFCKKLNIDRSRGKRGTGGRMIEQADRLLTSRAAFINGRLEPSKTKNADLLQFVDKYDLFLEDESNSGQRGLFTSEILLTEKFFNEITNHCVPIPLDAVTQFRNAPLELDIFQWLAYRMYSLKNHSRPTWQQLRDQFGSNYGRMVDFRTGFKEALSNVLKEYPHAKVEVTDQGLILKPSDTPVPKRISVKP